MHPAWIEVTAEIREGADVGTGVGERESEDSTTRDEGKNGSHSTRDETNRSTNGYTTGVAGKETETNISGAGNGSEESERNRVARGKKGTHGVTKHGGKIYRLRGRGHGTKHGRKHGKMHGK